MTGPFDPVLACGAMLGALGFVGMALMWAIEGAGRANDRRKWEQERADLYSELVDAWAEARSGMSDAPSTHDDLVAVLRAHGNGGERPSRPATAQAADRLGELADRIADLEQDNEGLSRHTAFMERHRMGEARLAAAARRVVAAWDATPSDIWAAQQAKIDFQVALDAIRGLAESVPSEPDNREALYGALTDIVGDIGRIEDEASRRTAAHMLRHKVGGWVGPRPSDHDHLLSTALAYQATYEGKPTDDPHVQMMRDANDAEIERLQPTDEPTEADQHSGAHQICGEAFIHMGEAVMRKIADGGSLDDVLEIVGDCMNERDAVDEDCEALFDRAKAALVGGTEADPEQIARLFHETYERLAPSFGYETRKASAVPWDDVPEQNKRLMIAVAGEVLRALVGGRSAAPTRDEVAGQIAEILADYSDDLTDADQRVEAINRLTALLSRSAAEPPEDQHAAALDIIRLLLAIGDEGQHYYELGDDGPTGRGSWVRVDAVTKAWEVWRDVTPAERAVIDGVAAEPNEEHAPWQESPMSAPYQEPFDDWRKDDRTL